MGSHIKVKVPRAHAAGSELCIADVELGGALTICLAWIGWESEDRGIGFVQFADGRTRGMQC